MALVLTAITVTMAFGHDRIVRFVRGAARYISKVSGVVLVLAGLFIVWYWATILASGSVALGSNPLVRWVDRISAAVTGFVADRPITVALVLGLAVVAAVLVVRTAGRSTGDQQTEEPTSVG